MFYVGRIDGHRGEHAGDQGEGDIVIGATINQTGTFRFKATNVGKDTMLAQIIQLVEQAQGSKAPIQRLADLIASRFVPIIIFVAIATFIVWFNFSPSPAFIFALVNAVAVLVIACPCALGLATQFDFLYQNGNFDQRRLLCETVLKRLYVEDGRITKQEYNAPFAIIARANGSGAVTSGGAEGIRTLWLHITIERLKVLELYNLLKQIRFSLSRSYGNI